MNATRQHTENPVTTSRNVPVRLVIMLAEYLRSCRHLIIEPFGLADFAELLYSKTPDSATAVARSAQRAIDDLDGP